MNNGLHQNHDSPYVCFCHATVKTSSEIDFPNRARVTVEAEKKDCGNPGCRDSGCYDGRHDKRDDLRCRCSIM